MKKGKNGGRIKPEKPYTNPKRQFSKSHVIYANTLVSGVFVMSFIFNFILAWYDKQQIDFVLPLSIVSIYGGFATAGYFTQNCIRDTSLNKTERTKYRTGFVQSEEEKEEQYGD